MVGSPDQVDADFKIEEGPGTTLSGGIGYSETYKFPLQGSYADSDFLGTGQRVGVDLDGGALQQGVQPAARPTRTPTSTTCSAPSRSATAT